LFQGKAFPCIYCSFNGHGKYPTEFAIGGIVDAEMLRPRSWIARQKIVAGQHLPLNIEELQVHGSAFVTAVDDCPEIARGEGSVVTALFITREVNTIVRAEFLGLDGKIEVIEGTPIHPIWSVDRNDWVPLGDVAEGESLQASFGMATALSLAVVACSITVYNIEVQGEHVYQVGEMGVVVHNACDVVLENGESAIGFMTNSGQLLGKISKSIQGGHKALADTIPNASSLCNGGQAFGFTVCKSSQGTKTVFGSGSFQHISGAIPPHLKSLILNLVD
jgi:hypothetical protein